ncbi:MAG TPA: HAMP domain-containing sensor histidine kinase [Dermatophilaceae bacterium]|nr:HAMP domain-containing sensor histidine kinase [Dermatophilaceae bacterium]
MSDRWRLGRLGRRLAGVILLVSAASLTVLFVGTVVPHLVADPPHPDDAVSPPWLLSATAVALVTAVTLSVVMARRLTRPIDGYIDTARRFAAGDHSARPDDLGPPEFADLTVALSAAAEEIERSEGARRRLTADIAHELRTPLTALQIGLEELRDGLVPADPATLAALHDQATRLGRIVNDLSELSEAESSGVQLHLSAVELSQLADLALSARQGSMESAGLIVEREIDPDVWVIADSGRMHQVVGNLLANTVLYCRPGDRVRVRVGIDGGHGVLEVSDNGPGFRPEELQHVFDRSWRGVSATGTRGSGLGLPIVRALAEAQGGKVWVDSVEGHGAAISVRLPLSTGGSA